MKLKLLIIFLASALISCGQIAPHWITNRPPPNANPPHNLPPPLLHWIELIPSDATYQQLVFAGHRTNYVYSVPLMPGYTYKITNDGSAGDIEVFNANDPATLFFDWTATNAFTTNFVASGDTLQINGLKAGPVNSGLRWYYNSLQSTNAPNHK